MSNKLQKVLSEIDKVKEKIAVQQTRLRELEQQKTELENMEIVGMVRGLDVPWKPRLTAAAVGLI